MKLLVNISSFYWIIFLYFLHNQYFIFSENNIQKCLSIFIYSILGLVLGYLSLTLTIWKTYKKTNDNLIIEKIYPIYREYMPVYLAIIVISFSINNFIETENIFTIVLIFMLIFILFYISNIAYLNPAWYLFGYRVYKIENKKANYVFINYKNKDYKYINNVEDIKKIDEFTFIKRKD